MLHDILSYLFIGKRYLFVFIFVLMVLILCKNNHENGRSDIVLKNNINLNFTFLLKKYKAERYFSPASKNELCKILFLAERAFQLDHKKVLAHWGLESRMNPRALGWNKTTYDGGLGQINSNNLSWLPAASRKFLIRMKLKNYLYLMANNNVDVYNPVSNAIMSISYMVMLEKKHGDGWESVISYNAGKPVPLVGNFRKYYSVYINNYNDLI